MMATSGATVSVEESTQKRCTYCFQELSEMTDPRLLPCQHIVCLICLQNDWKLDQLKCRACSKTLSVKIEELPKVRIANYSTSPEANKDTGTTLICEACDEKKPAIAYCVDCGKALCQEHKEMHRQIFKDGHQILSGETYSEKPDYYTKERCKTHTSQLISIACRKCDELFCGTCTVDTCLKGGEHEAFSIASTQQTLEAQFADMIKKCSDKVTELCKLEKQTWETVDTLNEKCADMIKHVEATAEKQIEEIQNRSVLLKKEIADYQAERLKRVEVYISDLHQKAEGLEQIQGEVKQFLRQSSTATIVRKRQNQHEELIDAHKLDTTTEFDCDERHLDKNGVVLCYGENMPLKLIPVRGGRIRPGQPRIGFGTGKSVKR